MKVILGMAKKVIIPCINEFDKDRPIKLQSYLNITEYQLGATILFKLRTNSLGLNSRIGHFTGSKECPACGNSDESLEHFLLLCPQYEVYRKKWIQTWVEIASNHWRESFQNGNSKTRFEMLVRSQPELEKDNRPLVRELLIYRAKCLRDMFFQGLVPKKLSWRRSHKVCHIKLKQSPNVNGLFTFMGRLTIRPD